MTSVQYTGHATALYMDYIDGETGRTLTAEPGGTYDVRVAPGRNPGLSPVPGDGRWTAVPPPEEDQPAEPAADPHAPAFPARTAAPVTAPPEPQGAPATSRSED